MYSTERMTNVKQQVIRSPWSGLTVNQDPLRVMCNRIRGEAVADLQRKEPFLDWQPGERVIDLMLHLMMYRMFNRAIPL